jgi:acetate kinase
MRILTLNIGSSSIKYALFDGDELSSIEKNKIPSHADFSSQLKDIKKPDAIVHRIVHGGNKFIKPTLLNEDVLAELEKLSPFAPLHQPYNLDGVRLLQNLFPDVPQYGCFDTAFHAGHDELHSTFAIPKVLRHMGLKRYGFHGLSYDWISRQVSAKRLIVAHLGSGASLCAILDGKSIDSTMGLTALDGLPMSTRAGNIDAGLILYLSKNLEFSPDKIEHVLYSESGMLGLSDISGDFKTLMESPEPQAKLAINYFCFKTAQSIAAMSVSLGGMDTLVFTGGVGENAPSIRDAIVDRLSFMPSFETEVIPTNEEKMMAIQVQEVMKHA